MELTHEFEVPLPVDRAFAVLTDVERVAPCVPGATLEETDGNVWSGSVDVRVGPVRVVYRGTAELEVADPDLGRAVLKARGQETRGSGTAAATVTAVLEDAGGGRTSVTVTTDLHVTGRPAQFGRGVIQDVGGKLIDQFVECLTRELSDEDEAASAPAGAETGDAARRPQADARPEAAAEPIDLLGAAAGPVAKRAALVLLGVLGIAVLVRLCRR